MTIQTARFARKPFEVEAVQVTAENFKDVAEWCGGEIKTFPNEEFIKIKVARVLNERQTKAFIGDWVLKAGQGFKVYTNKAFLKSFDPVEVKAVYDEQDALIHLNGDVAVSV